MMLAGYRDGITPDAQGRLEISILHAIQCEQTRAGLRSARSPSGDDLAGFLWYDIRLLGKRTTLQDIQAWQGMLDAVVAYAFCACAEGKKGSDSIGMVVTWTRLAS